MANKEIEEKIEELRILESQLQGFLAQKQSLQLEINEINNALNETKKTDGEIYKIVAGIMLRTGKMNVNKELNEKRKIIDAKISAMDKQEQILEKNSSDLRSEIDAIMTKGKQKNINV